MDDLVTSGELTGFPGAPFDEGVVAAAADAVRVGAGWHIAPVRTETVDVDTDSGRVALLPSLRVIKVAEVRDAETGDVLTGWRLSKHRGTLTRKSGSWPPLIEVDLTHGYESCPPALFPVIAERAQRQRAGLAAQESLGSRSVSYRVNYDAVSAGILARFALPARP